MRMRPAFTEDRTPGRYTPGRGTRMRQSAALAGSLLLNLLLLAGVGAAMRGPDILAPGVRSALVTVSIAPEAPRITAPPPATAPAPHGRRQKPAPAPRKSGASADALQQAAAPVRASTPAPSPPAAIAITPANTPSLRRETALPPASANDVDTYRQHVWQCILAARPHAASGSGMVTIRFRIDHEGGLVSAVVAGSSGQFMLDRLALQAVSKAAPFPAPPASMDEAALTFTVPVAFHR